MNPYIILLKFFFLINTVNPTVTPKKVGLSDFVIKKQSTYTPFHKLATTDNASQAQSSGSIMHAVSSKQELAIFCKMEHELMKASGFAVKFRLGDQSFVDQLEGK